MWRLGAPMPIQPKICVQLLTPPNLSCPSVSAGGWFQDPLQIPKSSDAPVPSIKLRRPVHSQLSASKDAQP